MALYRDALLNYLNAEARRRRGAEGFVLRLQLLAQRAGFFWDCRSGCLQVASRAAVPKKSSSGLVERGGLSACGTPLRLCASAPLRRVVQQCVPIESHHVTATSPLSPPPRPPPSRRRESFAVRSSAASGFPAALPFHCTSVQSRRVVRAVRRDPR